MSGVLLEVYKFVAEKFELACSQKLNTREREREDTHSSQTHKPNWPRLCLGWQVAAILLLAGAAFFFRSLFDFYFLSNFSLYFLS